jgi:hypothetical protein
VFKGCGMSLENLGLVLIGVGLVVAWGTAGIPPGGFKRFPSLLSDYRLAIENKAKPSDDARMAHLQLRCYQIGGVLTLAGCCSYGFGYFFGGN